MNLRKALLALIVAFSGTSGVAFADNNSVFDEPYWKMNLISIAGRAAALPGSKPFQQPVEGPYDFLTKYNP